MNEEVKLPELPAFGFCQSGSHISGYTADQMRAYGEQCRLATPEQPGSVPDAETMRLHMGELSTDEVRIAQAAYRWAMSGSAVQGEAVAWQVRRTDKNHQWETSTREFYDDVMKSGHYFGNPQSPPAEGRALYTTPPPAPAAEQGDGPLVEFFRGEGYQRFGWKGDSERKSPEQVAVEGLRELMHLEAAK